jgi:hypothetical protein
VYKHGHLFLKRRDEDNTNRSFTSLKGETIHLTLLNPTERGTLMSAISNTPVNNRNSLLRSIVWGGVIIGTLHLVIQNFLVFSLLYKTPFISVLQYVASGALGDVAFAGGLATALLGVIFHYLISFVIAAVFIMSATRIPLLRRNAIVGSILFGVAAWFVMGFIVIPLSATPVLPPPTLFQLIETIIDHALIIGLPLGILVWWNAKAEMKFKE